MTTENHKIVCIMVFMRIVCIMVFYENFLYKGSYKNCLYNGFLCILLVCGSELLVCDGFSFELLACGGSFYAYCKYVMVFLFILFLLDLLLV